MNEVLEAYIDKSVELMKRKKVCEYDNMNQSLIMNGSISKEAYEYNKGIIHNIFDHIDEYNYYDILKLLVELITF